MIGAINSKAYGSELAPLGLITSHIIMQMLDTIEARRLLVSEETSISIWLPFWLLHRKETYTKTSFLSWGNSRNSVTILRGQKAPKISHSFCFMDKKRAS